MDTLGDSYDILNLRCTRILADNRNLGTGVSYFFGFKLVYLEILLRMSFVGGIKEILKGV